MMEKLNPFYKAMTILIAGILLSFNYSVILNMSLFVISMVLIFGFSDAKKSTVAKILIPVGIAAISLFMTGFLHSGTVQTPKAGTFTSYNFSFITSAATSLYNALQLSTRVLGFAGLGLLFAFTTKGEDFIFSLMQQAHMKPKFAYGILAAFHLMPNIAKELDDAKLAYRVRGVRLSAWSLKPFFAVLVNCICWSENLAMAMESKGFDGDDDRTCYQIIKKGPVDVVFAIVTIGYVLIGMIFFQF